MRNNVCKIMRNAICMASILLLAGCSGCLNKVAALEIGITESYKSTTTLFTSGAIDAATAKKSLKATDAANAVAETAEKLCRIENPSAGQYITEASQLLAEAGKILEE